MNKQELQRLTKIEDRVSQIVTEDLGLKVYEVDFTVCNDQKMLEIMAYRLPTNISSWKYGRDFEKLRTVYEHGGSHLPYEVVINCLKYNTKVFTTRGIKNISNLEVGDMIWNGSRYVKVLNYKKNISSNNYKICLSNNKVVECTENHKFPVMTPYGMDEKYAKDLSEEDYFFQPLNSFDYDDNFCTDEFDYIPPLNGYNMNKFAYTKYCRVPHSMDEKLAELMGIIVGDGSIGHTNTKAADIIVGHPDIEGGNDYDKYIFSLIKDVFDIEPKVIKRETNDNYIKIVQILSSEIKEFFDFCGLKKNFTHKNKRVPHSIFLSSKRSRCAFVKGLFDTDGNVNGNKGITMSCYNKELAKDVSILLDSLNIRHYITFVDNKHQKISGIRIIGDGKKAYKKLIGSSIKRKKETLDALFNSKHDNDISSVSMVPEYFYKKYDMTSKRGISGKNSFYKKWEWIRRIYHCLITLIS